MCYIAPFQMKCIYEADNINDDLMICLIHKFNYELNRALRSSPITSPFVEECYKCPDFLIKTEVEKLMRSDATEEMTNEDAIRLLWEIKETIPDSEETLKYRKAIAIGIEAVGMQIAKKPLNQSDEYDGTYGNCPYCNAIVRDWPSDARVCSKCGQRLEWRR